jgi:hypothetical protein
MKHFLLVLMLTACSEGDSSAAYLFKTSTYECTKMCENSNSQWTGTIRPRPKGIACICEERK